MRLAPTLAVLGALSISTAAHASVVAHWSFDSDFTAGIGGSGYDLTAFNGATAGDAGGIFGNAATFQRLNGGYAFTTGDVLVAGNDFSYSAWYNLGVADIIGGDRYFVLETTAGDVPSTTAAWTASIGLRESGGDVVQVFSHPTGAVGLTGSAANTWENVIVTYDADGGAGGATGQYTAFLNGTSFATLDGGATPVSGLVIGGHRAGTGRNFEGQIDDVAFFNTVLTAQEIAFLQSNSAGSIPEPAAAALLALASVGLMLRRRRR